MKFKNNAPVTLYVVIDPEYGNVMNHGTNKSVLRAWIKEHVHRKSYVIVSYDQRGTR